jgi:hypothetical protein
MIWLSPDENRAFGESRLLRGYEVRRSGRNDLCCRVRDSFAIVQKGIVDPLSDVLSLIDPRSYAAAGFDLGGDWSIQFPPHNGIKCYALVLGQCWLLVDGVPDPIFATAGDCLLLTQGRSFRIASDLELEPTDAEIFYGETPVGGVTTYIGGETSGIAGHFEVSGRSSDILLGLLPPIVHLCWRRFKIEPPCRSKFEPGLDAVRRTVVCG